MTLLEFQEKYPTKEEKEKACELMTDAEIDELIASTNNIYAKIFYSELKKKNQARRNSEGGDSDGEV